MVLVEKLVDDEPAHTSRAPPPSRDTSRAPSRAESAGHSRPSSGARLIVHLPPVPGSTDGSRATTPGEGASRGGRREASAGSSRGGSKRTYGPQPPTIAVPISEVHVGSIPLSQSISIGELLARSRSASGVLRRPRVHGSFSFHSRVAASGAFGAFAAPRIGFNADKELPQNHPLMTPPIYHTAGTRSLSAKRLPRAPSAASGLGASQTSRSSSRQGGRASGGGGGVSAAMAIDSEAFLSRCKTADTSTARSTPSRLRMASTPSTRPFPGSPTTATKGATSSVAEQSSSHHGSDSPTTDDDGSRTAPEVEAMPTGPHVLERGEQLSAVAHDTAVLVGRGYRSIGEPPPLHRSVELATRIHARDSAAGLAMAKNHAV